MGLVERNLTAAPSRAGSSASSSSRQRAGEDRRIEVTHFLFLALEEYHETRPSNAGGGGGDDTAAAEDLLAAAGAAGDEGEDSEGGAAPSAALLEELGAATHACNAAYLDALLGDSAAGLPAEVVDKIRAEVQTQLEAKVDTVLAEVITATQQGGVGASGKPGVDALAQRFLALAATAGEPDSAAIHAFCDEVLQQEEVTRTIEPLVSLLVNFSLSRLQQ